MKSLTDIEERLNPTIPSSNDGLKVTNNFELTLPNQQRKGQYLHNTILGIHKFPTPLEELGYVVQKLFHMSDSEFDEIMKSHSA